MAPLGTRRGGHNALVGPVGPADELIVVAAAAGRDARPRRSAPDRTLRAMERNVGMLVVVIGIGVVLLGLLIASGALGWFGRLPGDLRHEGANMRVFVPITSMILVSVVLTVLVNVVGRFLR
jgi:hypothetical protein